MTEEEKFKAIQDSRNKNEQPSGVKVDPPTDEEGKGNEAGKNEGDKANSTPKEPTEAEKQQHAMAEMRTKFKRENEALKKELAELKKWKADSEAAKVKPKTREDFNSDAEYGAFVRKEIEDGVYNKVLEKMNEAKAQDSEQQQRAQRLSEGMESIQKGLSQKVFEQLQDPDSEITRILNDERGGDVISGAIQRSEYGADLLALLYSKPEIFKNVLEMPKYRQEYTICQMEDRIAALRSNAKAKADAEAEKRKRAESLPNTGAFGLNGNGKTDISGLSTAQRVERYKAEMRNS